MSLIARLPERLDTVWTCTRAGEADQAFLRVVFASARAVEVGTLGPDPALREAHIAMQMHAQRRSVALYYPGSIELVLRHRAQAGGRLWLHEDDSGLRIVDITLLPEWRGKGAARACLGALTQLADDHAWPLHLHVLADNPIRHWYARLGFESMGSAGLYLAMTRLPILLESEQHEPASHALAGPSCPEHR
jgi:GNAT superfamily N-acetyltransferase